MEEWIFYGIIYGVTAIIIYSVVLGVSAYRLYKKEKDSTDFNFEVAKILEDINEIITENVDKPTVDHKQKGDKHMKTNLTLSNLLTYEPTEENYDEVVDILAKLAEDTYGDYKFLIAKSSDEINDPNFLQIVSNWHENPEVHQDVFRKSVEYNLNMEKLKAKFADKVRKGEILPLGDEIEVIVNDGTPQLATGVSPINSGVEGGEIAFIVSFIRKENFEEFVQKNIKDEEEK